MSKPTRPRWKSPPEDPAALNIGPPQETAGGMPAIISSMKHAAGAMGVARTANTWRKVNQKGGFDCPGCAWPDPDDKRTVTEFCENGAKALAAEATKKRLASPFFAQWSVDALAEQSDYWLEQQGRLTQPMMLDHGARHYQTVSWENAYRLIADELNGLKDPNEAVFYTSGRTSNEAAFLYQLLVRLFGTNNLPDCSNMCHESSGVAMTEVIGIGKGTVTLDDFDHADCILIIGQNPGTNHPRMLTALQRAARNGCRIITANPLPEAGTRRFVHPREPLAWMGSGTALTTLFLQVRINGDVALLKGIMKELLYDEERAPGTVFDHDFISRYTQGYDPCITALRATSWDDIIEQSDLPREQFRAAADIIRDSKRIICCWAMGLTQHKNAVANIQEAINLLMLRGNLGRKGAGACPVRGHSNVQGDRTMGIWERPSAEFLARIKNRFGFKPPQAHGLNVVDAIKAMHAGNAKVFFAMGGNFLSASPDTQYTAEALSRCRLTVNVSTKLNRSHLVTGQRALILPCLGRTERDLQASGPQQVTVENSMGIVHASCGTLPPASKHLKSEVAIVCELALAVLAVDAKKLGAVDWKTLKADYAEIRDLIADVIPGFERYNARIAGGASFYLPNPVRDSRTFSTPNGKAVFTVHPLPEQKLGKDEFVMMTIRSHDQFNTTIYGLNDRYRGITAGRRVVMMNEQDMADAGFTERDRVDLVNETDGVCRVATGFIVVPYPIPSRCVATYFPEANVLVPIGSVADRSGTPAFKSVVIRIKPAKSESSE